MRIVLFLLGMAFIGLAQGVLSEPFIFQPDVGELGWPVGLAITALSGPLLWWASRPRGGRLRPPALAGLAAVAWLALGWVMLTATTEPWTLYSIPQWLEPRTMEYRPSPGMWLPFHALHVIGPMFTVLALGATEQPRRWRLRWLALGGAPWLLAIAAYASLAAQDPPVFMG